MHSLKQRRKFILPHDQIEQEDESKEFLKIGKDGIESVEKAEHSDDDVEHFDDKTCLMLSRYYVVNQHAILLIPLM